MEQQIKPVLCRYFLHGACSRGNFCTFTHDLKAKPDNVCKFYLAGKCGYGNQCRYDHIKPRAADINRSLPKEEIAKHSNMVPLKKKQNNANDEMKERLQWTNAPEFIPGKKIHKTTTVKDKDVMKEISFSNMASFKSNSEGQQYFRETDAQEETFLSYKGDQAELLCPFAVFRECPFGESCEYLHGDVCDMCGREALHPTDLQQRKEHEKNCETKHEEEMKVAFAAQRSEGVACSICLDIVKEKLDPQERYFGLLENCVHPFCLSCIRKWRSSNGMETTVVRTCPICREKSWFVTPSEYWIEDPDEKRDVIEQYKSYLSTKPCRMFDQGNGVCQFGTSCFYKHAYPDGTLDSRKPNLRYLEDDLGNVKVHTTPRLNEFIDVRDTS